MLPPATLADLFPLRLFRHESETNPLCPQVTQGYEADSHEAPFISCLFSLSRHSLVPRAGQDFI